MNENLVEWDDSFSVGFDHIDDQHKKLVDMINELIQGCKNGDAKEVVMKIFEKLADYVKIHFADEEKYLTDVIYPDLTAHKKQHQELLFELVGHVAAVEAGSTAIDDFVKFLKDWLLTHIAMSDKKYAPYLNKKGKTGLKALL